MKIRKSLMSAIMLSLTALNPFSSFSEPQPLKYKGTGKQQPSKHYAKPPTKAKFKQNQRKQRAASARKKAK